MISLMDEDRNRYWPRTCSNVVWEHGRDRDEISVLVHIRHRIDMPMFGVLSVLLGPVVSHVKKHFMISLQRYALNWPVYGLSPALGQIWHVSGKDMVGLVQRRVFERLHNRFDTEMGNHLQAFTMPVVDGLRRLLEEEG